MQQALGGSLVVVVIRRACTQCDAQRGKSMKHFIRFVDLLTPPRFASSPCFLSTNHSHSPLLLHHSHQQAQPHDNKRIGL